MIVQIESLSDMGWGQGKFIEDEESNKKYQEVPKDWQIRVPLVMPEEIVKVKIFKNMDTYSEGDLISVVKSSPYRVEPQCQLAGKCGGCQFPHMHISKQREWKTDFV